MRSTLRLRNPLVVVLLLSLVALACGSPASETVSASVSEGSTAVTSDAPALDTFETASLLVGEYETLSGEVIDLASLQGDDVVMWFWAPW